MDKRIFSDYAVSMAEKVAIVIAAENMDIPHRYEETLKAFLELTALIAKDLERPEAEAVFLVHHAVTLLSDKYTPMEEAFQQIQSKISKLGEQYPEVLAKAREEIEQDPAVQKLLQEGIAGALAKIPGTKELVEAQGKNKESESQLMERVELLLATAAQALDALGDRLPDETYARLRADGIAGQIAINAVRAKISDTSQGVEDTLNHFQHNLIIANNHVLQNTGLENIAHSEESELIFRLVELRAKQDNIDLRTAVNDIANEALTSSLSQKGISEEIEARQPGYLKEALGRQKKEKESRAEQVKKGRGKKGGRGRGGNDDSN